MQWGVLARLKERLKELGLSGKLNTAFVERVNLTLRQSIGFLIRRTWGTAHAVLALREHIQWWRGYYHFVRPHEGLREELTRPVVRKGGQQARRHRVRTPAMAVGITGIAGRRASSSVTHCRWASLAGHGGESRG